jgi:hypothetical protein
MSLLAGIVASTPFTPIYTHSLLSFRHQIQAKPTDLSCLTFTRVPQHLTGRIQHGRLRKSGDATENSPTRLYTTLTDDTRKDSTHGTEAD